MKIVDDFILNSEYTREVFMRIGNKLYRKKVLDKYYRLWKKFKNATRAKKFLKKIELEKGIELFGRSKNVYISSRMI